jgi:hypothetical protein
MEDNGLIIHSVPEDTVEKWRSLVDEGFEMLVGVTISREIYEQAIEVLRDFRNP